MFYEEAVDVGEVELGRWVKPKHALGVFLPRRAATGGPNYMPEEVMQMLEAEGIPARRHLDRRRWRRKR